MNDDAEVLEDYCETNLDDILHLKRTFSLDKSPRKIKAVKYSGSIRKKKRSCCMTKFCRTNKSKSKGKAHFISIPEQRTTSAPLISTKDFISTPSSSIVDEIEQIHVEECRYCSSESALSLKLDPNNNHWENISQHSLQLFHAVELYLSSNSSSLNELSDCSSSFFSEQTRTIIQENKQLNLCEINQIIFAIHSNIDDEQERNETLDALASSLREVADDLPMNICNDDHDERTMVLELMQPHLPPPGLGQVFIRAVMYEIVMRLFSFYLFILLCFGHLS